MNAAKLCIKSLTGNFENVYSVTEMDQMRKISNFGKNVQFRPQTYYEPVTEAELCGILDKHANGKVRVIGSGHSWSDCIVADEALVCMKHFRSVEIVRQGDEFFVRVGAGCQIKHLLAELQKHGLTLPSVGLITEQTIAGATATGTHGSGKQSLSHFINGVRVACYRKDGASTVREIHDGDDLRAARCNLGCLGIIVSIELPCIIQYNVEEKFRFCETVGEALASETDSPLQQFYLLPHRWDFAVQERSATSKKESWMAAIYHFYWWLVIDVLFCLFIKLFASVFRSKTLVRLYFRFVAPLFVIRNWKVTGRSDQMLVMEHELFRHLELEAFVPRTQLVQAVEFVECVLKQADGKSEACLPESMQKRLHESGLWDAFEDLQGRFSHHFPVCVRRILRDETLISMSSGDDDCWYSISFITYVEPREPFYQMATFLAKSLLELFDGRIHWGKWFPLDKAAVDRMYPSMDQFDRICRRFDPNQVFQNKFTELICGEKSATRRGEDIHAHY